jgi:hypothetical protein
MGTFIIELLNIAVYIAPEPLLAEGGEENRYIPATADIPSITAIPE